ncbi:MAG: tetratricopeptide repeat protein [Candidatus Obscuribacterales bacterium]|nr:tetratricopeptide repeat protein [Candidatus Obscuribacterales bacterium]
MNRRLPQSFFLLFLFCAVQLEARLIPAAAAVVETQPAAHEEEFNESKLFPKRGKYLDWIAANTLNNQGIRYARAGKNKDAIAMFQKAIQRYSHDYTFYENLGAALHNSGNLERAESTTQLAAQLAPRRWGPWYNLGIILTKEHQYARALKVLKRAKALHAPASKMTGINKLIAALERKLAGPGQAPQKTAEDPEDNPSQAEQTAGTDATASPENGNANSNAGPSQNSGTNPYTTIPAVSPLPAAPANSVEKGN